MRHQLGAILSDIPQIPGLLSQIFGLIDARRQPPLDALLANPELRFIESRANPVMTRVAWG